MRPPPTPPRPPDRHEGSRAARAIRAVIRRVIPPEVQPPTDLPRRLLASAGYFRLRTWVAAHGSPVSDAHLYRPLYSPWEGDARFEPIAREVAPHTLVSRDRCWILWRTLLQASHLEGDFVECGVYRGGTALLAARTLAHTTERADHGRLLHLFDSFSGMPATTDADRFERGDLSRTSVEAVGRLLAPFPFVRLHAGFIPHTFEGLDVPRIAWAHVDLDLYQSVRDSIAWIYPRLVPGGFLVFDDYGFPSCPGARRAVDEAFSDAPEAPICLPTGQCIVIKLQ